jgi:hypothetical protein
MKHRLFISGLAALLLPLCLSAQTIPVNTKPGKVSAEECSMTTYPLDTAAAALILYEQHDVRIDFNVSTGSPHQWVDHFERIKILKESGKDYADFSLLFSTRPNDNESFPTISVTTYNWENGKVVSTKMQKSSIFRAKYNDHYDKVSFAAPNVKAGSVIEVRIELSSGRFEQIDDFYFQREIPVNLCKYSVMLPRWLRVNKLSRGSLQPEITQDNVKGLELGDLFPNNFLDIDDYVIKDVPALDREPGVYCIRQYRSSVSYTVSGLRFPSIVRDYSTHWEDVDKLVQESEIVRGIKANCRFKDEVDATKAGGKTPQEQLADIIALVRSKVEWNRNERLVPSAAAEVLRTRSGSNVDINALVGSAARYAGFDVKPVLIRKRTEGALLDFHPDTDAFSTFILRIEIPGSNPLYIDAADPAGWFNVLDDNYLVTKARVVPLDGVGEWEDLSRLSRNVRNYTVQAKLSPDGTLEGDCSIALMGAPSYGFKSEYLEAGKEDDVIESLEKKLSAEVDGFSVEGACEFSSQASVRFHFSKSCDHTAETIFVNPYLEQFHSEAAFRAENRTLPVDFQYPENIFYTLVLQIPEGYTVDQVPETRRLQCDLPSTVIVSSAVDGNIVRITYRFTLDAQICLPEAYPAVRNYWRELCALYNQMIVIKKIADE